MERDKEMKPSTTILKITSLLFIVSLFLIAGLAFAEENKTEKEAKLEYLQKLMDESEADKKAEGDEDSAPEEETEAEEETDEEEEAEKEDDDDEDKNDDDFSNHIIYFGLDVANVGLLKGSHFTKYDEELDIGAVDENDDNKDRLVKSAPGLLIGYDWRPIPYFSLGVAFQYALLEIGPFEFFNNMRLSLVPRGILPLLDDKLQLSLAVQGGALLSIVTSTHFRQDTSMGYSILGVLGIRYYFGNWGVLFDIRGGFEAVGSGDMLAYRVFQFANITFGLTYGF